MKMEMIYFVNFRKLAEKIDPLAFAKYLQDTGWVHFQTKRKYIKVFQMEKGAEFYQVTIPMDKILRDYQEAMYKATWTVAEAESKPVEQVILYLLNSNPGQ